jgi:hypothetical protein
MPNGGQVIDVMCDLVDGDRAEAKNLDLGQIGHFSGAATLAQLANFSVIDTLNLKSEVRAR